MATRKRRARAELEKRGVQILTYEGPVPGTPSCWSFIGAWPDGRVERLRVSVRDEVVEATATWSRGLYQGTMSVRTKKAWQAEKKMEPTKWETQFYVEASPLPHLEAIALTLDPKVRKQLDRQTATP